jgi:YwiC-like protein
MVMLPREHGAYSQMALPLVTSLVIARAAPPSVFIALAVVCGFLAHEPLLVLLGGRGVRSRQTMGSRAAVRFTVSAVAMFAAGAAGFRLSPAATRWSFLLPVIPAAWVGASLLAGEEKRAPSEIAVALAFAFTVVPICAAAGVSLAIALSVAAVFASVYVAGVLCVRVIVLGKRAGGNLHARRTTRLTLIAIAVASVVGLAVATERTPLPWTMLVAVAPGLITAVALAMRRSPPPLKSVGWSLALTSTAAALIVIGAARHVS